MNVNSFDLNLLIALDALLAESHVSRAADRLLIGQPAMSATLARLRLVFDDPLLVRDGRGLKPTPFALTLKKPVSAILAQVHSLINTRTQFDPANDERTFTVLASDYVALVLLRPLIERLQDIAPNVQIHVRPVGDTDVIDRLLRSQIDLIIMPKELLPPRLGVPSALLFEDRFVCVADANNPDVGNRLTTDQFSQLPYLVSSHGVLPSIVEDRFDAAGITRRTEMVAGTFVMAPFLIPGTRLITVIQEKLATLLLADTSKFRILPTPEELDPISELMVWSPKNTSDVGHEWLRGELLELAEQI